MQLTRTIIAACLFAAAVLPARAQTEAIDAVSYTHLTLPTTPYV